MCLHVLRNIASTDMFPGCEQSLVSAESALARLRLC